jgi:hypothetical protein
MRRILLILSTAILMITSECPWCMAQATNVPISEDELADEVNDPIATLTQMQVKEQYTPAEYGTNAQPNTLQLRSVLYLQPHLFTPLEQLIRPTVQVVTVPRNQTASTITALDDFQLLDLFIIPYPDAQSTGFRWGIGPYWVFPTSTNHLTGRGAWQVGPALGYSWQLQRLKMSTLFQHSTSFAYTSSRSKSVAQLQIQPILNYDLAHRWYLSSSNANWKINLRHKSSTVIPFSFGMGKVWKISENYAINTSVEAEWMLYRQFADQNEQFTLNFSVSLLLPRVSG